MRKCPVNFIETYVEYTRWQNAPERYHMWVALSLLASTLQRRCFMDRGFYTLYPNLYIAIVGPTGFTKTTAADFGMKLLKKVPNLSVIKGKATSWYLADWFGQMTGSGKDCACTIYSGEMKNLLGDLNKTELVTFLTNVYTCPDEEDFHQKKSGKMTVKNVCINLIACSTPEWLVTGTTTDEISGGFTGRFIYIFADSGERDIAFPEDYMTPEIRALEADLINDLQEINKLKGQFKITNEAKALYTVWYATRKKEWTDERLIGYYARKGDLVLKIAMCLSVAQDDTMTIDHVLLKSAKSLLDNIEAHMTQAFSGIVDDPSLRHKDRVLKQIEDAVIPLSRSDILRKNWNQFDSLILDRIITNLVEAKLIKQQRNSKTGELVYVDLKNRP